MRRALGSALVSLGVTIALLVVGEVVVRATRTQPLEWPGIEGRPRISAIRIDPLLGPRLRPNTIVVKPFAIAADERGYRSTGLPHPATPRARVAFLGDSCTFGWGVGTPDTFVAQLDARQRRDGEATIDFMNAGYPGMTAVSGEYLLREDVLPRHPDVVVLGFSANNAFRFADAPERERFGLFGVRKLLRASRLASLVMAWLANQRPPTHNPRTRSVVLALPLRDVWRTATVDEFASSVRAMVADARRSGAQPVLLVFPRASTVSQRYRYEDAGVLAANLPPPEPRSEMTHRREVDLLEASCLDHRRLADPVGTLRERAPSWRPVYPPEPALHASLASGARAYRDGRYAEAVRGFARAVESEPASPLAHYDLGVARLAAGDDGLPDLARADELACNVFLQHAIALWRLAHELRVPVVDLTLHFQAHDGKPLFLDPAHPSVAGHAIVADALWPVIRDLARPEARPTHVDAPRGGRASG